MAKQQLHHWIYDACMHVRFYVSLNSIHDAFILFINNERLSFIYIEFLISDEEIQKKNTTNNSKRHHHFPTFIFVFNFTQIIAMDACPPL